MVAEDPSAEYAEGSAVDAVLHPVRMKIVGQLGGRTMTTTQLREALPEVKQATLYRHISALLEAQVLTVVDERKVRGAVERTLGLGERLAHVDHEGLDAMDDVQLRSAFLGFLTSLSSDFERLLDESGREDRGLLGFTRAPLYIDPEELPALQSGLMDLLAPYLEPRREGQRRFSLATVLLPEVDSASSEQSEQSEKSAENASADSTGAE
ncbi:helix-turn-helix domain-containing protein [Brevibacterium renqingii]|uniref:helix-turn-helix domain-containing protein n=1 Tax=Brevibacterium renqingii TaxID=2776916 RepID=UPI001AE06768|nr:helix-turn-helix domain-containing protein [Brevibacterium renqingii]